MTKSFKIHACLLASTFILSPATAVAQNAATTTTDANLVSTTDTNGMDTMGTTAAPAADPLANDMALAQTTEPQREEHHDFPWGLLGLLGLAGLLGMKRRDDDHVRVDRTGGTTNNRM